MKGTNFIFLCRSHFIYFLCIYLLYLFLLLISLLNYQKMPGLGQTVGQMFYYSVFSALFYYSVFPAKDAVII